MINFTVIPGSGVAWSPERLLWVMTEDGDVVGEALGMRGKFPRRFPEAASPC